MGGGNNITSLITFLLDNDILLSNKVSEILKNVAIY